MAKEHIGKKIKRLRSFRGMTQDDMAIALGKTRSLVSFLERTGKVNKYTLQEIANVLKISVEEIESGLTEVKELEQPSISKLDQTINEQLQKEIQFLKETINHQWTLLHELAKSK
jgi:transcriptional regulator with XRE-family HTH domain